MLKIFDSNGNFSWRKAGTATCYLLFAVSVIGYLINNDFGELPNTYQAIIAGVFAFYFAKDVIRKIK